MADGRSKVKLLDATLVAGVKIDNVAAWCRQNEVAPATFYRHRAKFEARGRDGLVPLSRAPKSSPTATPPVMVAAIGRLRVDLAPGNGAAAIHARLLAEADTWAAVGVTVPCVRTVNRVLQRLGLVVPTPAKRPRSSWRRFSYARPRDCWQLDGTAHQLADGTTVVAMDLIDDCTRFWLASLVVPGETTDAAIAVLTSAVADFGAPGMVLTDNGSAFVGGCLEPFQAPGRFALAVTGTGARLIRSSPYHPQTLGKCERLHQTAKALLRHFHPAGARTAAQLQTQLDAVRGYYNHERHHDAVPAAPHTPASAWAAATAPGGVGLGGPDRLPVQTDATVYTATCDERGRFRLGKITRIALHRDMRDQHVTAVLHGNVLTVYDPDGHPVAHGPIDRTKNYQRLDPAA